MRTANKRCNGFTLVELLVVVAIIGILIGMLLPAVQAVRIAARRTACVNQVRQIALALHNYESAYARFPAGVVDDDNNHRECQHSALVFILPFLEQQNISDQYDLDLDWKSGPNLAVAQIPVPVFLCPENNANIEQDGGISGAPLDYALNKGTTAYLSLDGKTTGIFDINSRTRFGDIQDGTSMTLLLGEAASNPGIPAAST